METANKTALVFGATGAVGQEVVRLLLTDQRYKKVKAFSRSALGISDPKLEEVIDPLKNLTAIEEQIKGDDLFCCLGTTSRKAGSKEAFRRVDLELPDKISQIAEKNGVEGFIAVSSIGAGNPGRGFYLNVKTEMEQRIGQRKFKRKSVVRPSLLLAKRSEFRFTEEMGKLLNLLFGWAMVGKMRRYRGIKTSTVASAMIEIMNIDSPNTVYESDALQQLGK